MNYVFKNSVYRMAVISDGHCALYGMVPLWPCDQVGLLNPIVGGGGGGSHFASRTMFLRF